MSGAALPRSVAFINRNLLLLFGCQMVFVSGSIMLVTVGGIVGYQLSASPSIATLPVALMVVGTATATVPASFTMQRFGRKRGFLLATAMAASGAGLAALAVDTSNFWLFCAATGLVGMSLGFSQQFRFAAAESVALEKVSHAISFILLGSIAGAYMGPEVVAYSARSNPDAPYTLGFLVLIGLYGISALLLLGFRDTHVAHAQVKTDGEPRSLLTLIRHPLFLTAVLAGIVGQGTMTYVMTATPISMNVTEGFSILTTSEVIRWHVIAMYLPSLATPWLVGKLGLPRMMFLGVVAMGSTLAIGLAGQHLMHYWFALVLLGIGWNFLFVAGTTMLVQSYQSNERFKAQALNDFSVFATSAMASLMAGSVLHLLGWTSLLFSAIPALIVMLGTLFWLTRSKRLGSWRKQ